MGIGFHAGIPPRSTDATKFPPSQTCLCLTLSSSLFFSDRVTAVAFQNVFGNVNMLTNRYRIRPLMCMTMDDPTWAFVLAATEVQRLTGQLLMCRPFKIPLPVRQPQLSA